MPVDTANKRASALTAGRPPIEITPIPDGTIIQADRQQITWVYAGILAAEAAVVALPTIEGNVPIYASHSDLALLTSHKTILALVTDGSVAVYNTNGRVTLYPSTKDIP